MEGRAQRWRGKKGVEQGKGRQGPSADEGGPYLDICAGVSEFLVTPLVIGPVCLLS